MSLRTAPFWGRRRAAWVVANNVVLVIACLALAHLVVMIVLTFSRATPYVMTGVLPWTLLSAAAAYLIGHGFRVLRLALLIGGWSVGFRVIASLHLMTAAVGLVIPLKLGDSYRVVVLSNVAGGWIRAIAIVWWERAFDVAYILIILAVAFVRHADAAPEFSGVAMMAAAFILATAVVFFVVPDNLRRLSLLIIRRYDDRRTIPLLRLLDVLHRAIREAPRMVRGKAASLITLTALIWICEIACFAIMLPLLGGALVAAPDALIKLLSSITLGQTLFGELKNISFLDDRNFLYLLVTQVPLAVIGFLAAIGYVARRFRDRHSF